MRRFRVPVLLWLPLRIFMGLTKPRRKILGQELAGEIESTGTDVKRFKKGDQVFGTTGFRFGAYAEFVCLPAISKDGAVALKPTNATYEEAAAVPTGGIEALHLLKKGDVRGGESVLVNGAGGSIGTFAVQLAKYYGADVTAVDSTGKLDLLRSIGADRVIDYTQEDFTASGRRYDVVFDVTGKIPFSRLIQSLGQNGRCLLANPRLSDMLRGMWIAGTSGRRIVCGPSNDKIVELGFLKELIEAGKIRPVLDRRYPFERLPEAHSYVDGGDKKGNVVVTVGESERA